MTTKYTITIGLNDKDTKVQKISTLEAYKVTENLVLSEFGGGTIYETKGVYKHESGEAVRETSLKIEILYCERAKVVAFCKTLKAAFNQEAVILEETKIQSELI